MSKQQTLDSENIEETENVRCEICGKEFQKITNTHLRKHDVTINEYMEQFPDAFLITEGCRKKISEATLGKPSSLKGRHKTKEHKQKLREANLGKHHTGEHKQKLREANLGKKASEKTKQLMSKNHWDCSGEKHPMFGKKGELCPSWQGGISSEPYCEKFDNDLRERVRNFFNRCCYVCGKNEIDNGRKLDVHHVNYNKMVCCNDVKPLFVPLCRSCHAKTSGDCEYWEEFFTVSLNYLTNGECFIQKEVNKN